MRKGWVASETIQYVTYYTIPKTGRKQRRKTEEKRLYLSGIAKSYEEYAKYLPYDAKDEAMLSEGRLRYADDSRKKKSLRQSDFIAMLEEAGFLYHRAIKPFPGDAYSNKIDSYYEGRELKQLYSNYLAMHSDSNVSQGDESRLSRAYGSLIAGGQLYSVFDAERSGSMRTTRTYEGAYLNVVSNVFGTGRTDKRILLADDCTHLEDFLFHSYVPEGRSKKGALSGSAADKLLEDAFYESTYLIPKTKEGILMLRMMRIPGLHERLNRCLGLVIQDEDVLPYDMQSDGKKWEEGRSVYELNFLDMNLDALLTFINASGIRKEREPKHRYRVHAYDFVVDDLKRSCNSNYMEIVGHSISDIWDALGKDFLKTEDK